MITYRIYTIGSDGHFANIEVAECVDDKDVVEKALAQANGRALEIWDHKRFVVRLPGDPPKGKNRDARWQSIGDLQPFLRTCRSYGDDDGL